MRPTTPPKSRAAGHREMVWHLGAEVALHQVSVGNLAIPSAFINRARRFGPTHPASSASSARILGQGKYLAGAPRTPGARTSAALSGGRPVIVFLRAGIAYELVQTRYVDRRRCPSQHPSKRWPRQAARRAYGARDRGPAPAKDFDTGNDPPTPPFSASNTGSPVVRSPRIDPGGDGDYFAGPRGEPNKTSAFSGGTGGLKR